MHSKTEVYFFIACAIIFYALAGIAFNPLILWTALPLYLGYAFIKSATVSGSIVKCYSSYGFIIASVGFSLFYHLTWFFDWQGTKTGSSTSALIFIWLPIYAVVLGFIGQFIGKLVGNFCNRK